MSTSEKPLRYLTEAETRQACAALDPVTLIRRALAQHDQGETDLPGEVYLGWTGPDGAAARSIAMSARLSPPASNPSIGTKVINASLGNSDRGLPRASGLLFMVDPQTARIRTVMAAQHISAVRTAAVSVLAAQELCVPHDLTVGVIGAGVIARAHVETVLTSLPGTEHVTVYDQVADRAEQLVNELSAQAWEVGTRLTVAATLEAATRGSMFIVAATTAGEPYLDSRHLDPGAVIANVSLDDVTPEAVERCDLLVVDSWPLVRDDPHRLLGRMHRAGRLRGPDEPAVTGLRSVDTELGRVLTGEHPGRRRGGDVVIFNPFGMAINDIALGAGVQQVAEDNGLGCLLDR